jgi:hypothetical protein
MSTYGAYQDSLLGHVANQTTHHTTNHSKLEDIKTKLDSVISNTGDLDLNTDGLETSLTSIDGKITQGNDDTLSDAQQVVLYGKDYTYNNLHVLQTSTQGKLEIDNNVMAVTNTKIQDVNTTLTDGTQKTLLIGSNDINGNTPHRHLTVDTNGRLLTIPSMTATNNAIGTTNTKLTTIEGDTTSIDGKITQGEGNITGGGNGLQQILCYGKDQSGNLDPLNVDNNGHLKITLNDIESGIATSLPVKDERDYGSLTTLDSALAVPSSGNNDSSIISNNKLTDTYIVQVQCDDNTYTDFNAEILESIDASNYKSGSFQISQGMTPAFFIFERIEKLAPNWKVRVNNTGLTAKNFTIKYIKA